MFASRNEVIVESQNDLHKDGQQQKHTEKHVRPNGPQVKRRNMSGGQNVSQGGSKRRFQYNQNSNKLAAMFFPSLSDSCRNTYRQSQAGDSCRPVYRHNLSPVVEIKVSDENKNSSNHYIGTEGAPQGNSPGHQHSGNVGTGVTAHPGTEDEHTRQMNTGKYHNPYYGRGQYQQQTRGHQYLFQGDGRNNGRDHKWHCSGWGACTCGQQKQWNGREYPRTPNGKTGGNFMYTEMPLSSRSPTPSLKSESPPAVTSNIHGSPVMVNTGEMNHLMTVSTDSQLSSNRSHHSNGYESDSSHSSHQQQQQQQQMQQQQSYVPSCDYFFDLGSSSYQLAEVMSHQHHHIQGSSQSSLNSNHTDEAQQMGGYGYEILPYFNHRTPSYLFYDPTPLNPEIDGYLRKRYTTVTSPQDSRRSATLGTPGNRRKRNAETPPDHFIARAHLVMMKKIPKQLLTGGQWDELSQMVWSRFMLAQQTEETYVKKMNLWKSLFVYIRSTHPRYGLYLVGSTMTGFGADTSDVDMCLVSKYRTELEPRTEAIVNLMELQNFLALNKKFEMFHLIEAKVPILRFRDADNHIEVDLNYNNCVGIRNTHLLYWYSNMDWRVRPLVLVVKMWAQYHCINNAKNSTISSYSLVLMVIHFLQAGVTPAILPCLHKMYPEKFGADNDIRTINIHENLKAYNSQNQQTLGELFLQFLEYFSNFDYSLYAISVRTASCLSIDFCRMQRSPKNDCHQWKHLCIEEPFDLTNTARSVYDSDVFEKIKFIFMWSWKTLEATMDINAIFKPIYGYAFHPAPSR
uniref:Uncharacterized protein n=2 Tax=Lutzomyia longipalpis TaxID=7200 RepID=A0A1B0GL72_LUTLO